MQDPHSNPAVTNEPQYWNHLWENNETRWDIGYPSPAIADYMSKYPNKEAAILIPGCGNGYEATFLADNGFTNITLIDIAPAAVENLRNKFATTSQVKVICGDFFKHDGKYNLIIEQTFFCALPPMMRNDYAKKTSSLLADDGQIIGLLFNKIFEQEGPPFGGSAEEYERIFSPFYHIREMSRCENSIPQRQDSEVFIILGKR